MEEHKKPEPDFEQRVTITYNESGKFEDRWAKLLVNQKSPCIFTRELAEIDLPVRHGEGRFIPATKEILNEITRNDLHVLQYIDDKGGLGKYPWNPNGSVMNIAGICDRSGQVFGLMPHPEGFQVRENHPQWTRLEGLSEGAGMRIFKNAVEFAEKELC